MSLIILVGVVAVICACLYAYYRKTTTSEDTIIFRIDEEQPVIVEVVAPTPVAMEKVAVKYPPRAKKTPKSAAPAAVVSSTPAVVAPKKNRKPRAKKQPANTFVMQTKSKKP